jgi:hypothetical protein
VHLPAMRFEPAEAVPRSSWLSASARPYGMRGFRVAWSRGLTLGYRRTAPPGPGAAAFKVSLRLSRGDGGVRRPLIAVKLR